MSYCANFSIGNFSYLYDLKPVLLTMDGFDLPVPRTSCLVSIQSVQPKTVLNIRLYNINIFLAWHITKYPEERSADFLKSERKVNFICHLIFLTPRIASNNVSSAGFMFILIRRLI
jgi:hypothetical protein